ncbi:MAG TPA: hypothetical protein ENK05_06510 [Gammaproteobacteria bacterium]|nr:hypothetical protein [Gammaproteobacteria bacterium]
MAEAVSPLNFEGANSTEPASGLNFEGRPPASTDGDPTGFGPDGVYRPTSSRFVVTSAPPQPRQPRSADAGGNTRQSEFGRRNFKRVSYLDTQGKSRPMYEMTKDGFTLLAMGFTGNKAIAWKVRYIEAFNAMADALSRRPAPTPGGARRALAGPGGDYRVLAPLFDDLHSSTRTALVLGYFLDAPATHPGGWHCIAIRKLGKLLAFTHPQAAIYRVHALRERGFLLARPEWPDRPSRPLLYRPDRDAILRAAKALPQAKYDAIAARVKPARRGTTGLH